MKKILLLLLLWVACPAGAARGSTGAVGVGVIFPEPTGVSLKVWLGGSTAVDGALAWDLGDSHQDYLRLHADYLWHAGTRVPGVKWYYGAGARLATSNKSRLGFRVPVGLSRVFSRLELFGELAPVLDLVPATKFDIDVGVGIRFLF